MPLELVNLIILGSIIPGFHYSKEKNFCLLFFTQQPLYCTVNVISKGSGIS